MNKKTIAILFFSVFLFLGGCSKKIDVEISEIAKSQVSMAVNAFLWRASLDTVSFIPLDIVDPIGGVITTKWYEDTNNPNERIKLTIYVKDRRLRADGLSVSVFREIRGSEDWAKVDTNPDTARLVEASILTKARELRIGTLGNS
ncbi:DUF3576 domain-containing protein [Rhodobiaceae bacterium]|jgi:hypothetical protein|nr:DUF3576 domain-containing protein [Rhodobiaceae bacterium]